MLITHVIMDLKSIKKSAVLGFACLLTLLRNVAASQTLCGFPGTPAFGYVKPDADLYHEGDVVTYSCRVGYIMLGAPKRRCLNDGTWTEKVPICDDSMTTLGFASATPAVPGYPPENAIDRDKDTCTHLLPKNTRWWRIDLGAEHKVLSVAITMADTDKYTKFTVFIIKVQGTSASYKRCASFSGNFGTSTIVLTCAEGKGIDGQKVHIEDHLKMEGLFEVCEVEVQVEKDNGYECGRPDRNSHSITSEVKSDQVEYSCLRGYELKGRDYRICLSNGQWKGEPPACEAIVCDPLPVPENGNLVFSSFDGDEPLEGAVVNYKCNEGFNLLGDYHRECGKDGSWSGENPHCEVVRCNLPDGASSNGKYALVNRTTRMGGMALLKCKKGKMEGNNPFIVCKEDGQWSESEARCLIPAGAVIKESPQIAKKGALIFGMIVACIMVIMVFVSLYVISKRRNRASKPELPSRHVEALQAPPRPPPRTKGAQQIASTLLECVTGGSVNDDDEPQSKPRSPPLKNLQMQVSPQRAFLDNTLVEREPLLSKVNSSNTDANDTPLIEDEQESKLEEVKNTTGPKEVMDYAAIDYEKKRQSRLRKRQLSDRNSDEEEEELPTLPLKESKEQTEDTETSGRSKRTRSRAVDDVEASNTRRINTHPEELEEKPRGFRRTRGKEY